MNEITYKKYGDMLEKYLSAYHSFVTTNYQHSDDRNELQRSVPLISSIIYLVHGDVSYKLNNQIWYFNHALGYTLREGKKSSEMYHLLASWVELKINESIGNIRDGLIPSPEIQPVIPINNNELKARCLDLLNAKNKYDRIINQATLVLEDKLRTKLSAKKLAEFIPESKDQIGEQLAHRLLSGKSPKIVVSNKPNEREGFHKMVIGIFSYLRNPTHHYTNDDVELNFAWSVVGIVDYLLAVLEKSYVSDA